jgi:hypothetical protein
VLFITGKVLVKVEVMFSAIRSDFAKVAPLKMLTLRPSSVLTFIEIPEV